jgi:hypothetical protein
MDHFLSRDELGTEGDGDPKLGMVSNLIWRVALLHQPQDMEVAFARRDWLRFGSGHEALPLSVRSRLSLFWPYL